MGENSVKGLAIEPNYSAWPDSGVAPSAHDPVEFQSLGQWGELLDALDALSPEMREAVRDWAPPFTWFEASESILMTPTLYPETGLMYHGELIGGAAFAVYIRVGDWWMCAGQMLFGRTWAGLQRTTRRPRPFLGQSEPTETQWRN